MPRYMVELLRPLIRVELEAASDDEAHWLAVETFRDDLKETPMRVTELEESA